MKFNEAPFSPQAGSDGLEMRLAAYSRYAAVVQAQFQALQEEDVERFSVLADRRQEIQEELEADDHGLQEFDELDEEGQRLLKGARNDLAEAAVLDKEIRHRLIRLRGKVAGEIKGANRRKGSVKEYLTQEEQTSRDRPSRVNVRL